MKVLITAAVLATALWLASPQPASAGWYGPQIYIDAYVPVVPYVPVYTPYVGVSFYGGYWGSRAYWGRPYGYGGYYGGGYYGGRRGYGGHRYGGHRGGGGYGGHRGGHR